jgi:hypothetical protein
MFSTRVRLRLHQGSLCLVLADRGPMGVHWSQRVVSWPILGIFALTSVVVVGVVGI